MRLITVLAAAAILAPAVAAQETFEIRQLHPRVYAALVTARPAHYAFANSLIVVGDSGVLIVDTQQSPGAAGDLIRALPELTDRPVRWIVNTHWHGDHVFGNAAWKQAHPEARIVAHRTLVDDVAIRAAAQRDSALEEIPWSIEERERWLAENERGGVPLDSAARDAILYSLQVRKGYLSQLQDLRMVPPDRVVDDSLVLQLGGVEVTVVHAGPAHTRGDVFVRVDGTGIVAVGDLLEAGLPWLAGSCPAGWARALDHIRGLRPDAILMSHGGVAGPAFLDLYARLLERIAAGGDLEPFLPAAEEMGVSPRAFHALADRVRDAHRSGTATRDCERLQPQGSALTPAPR